uniref:Uncharacterized protein n=1 Tax=Hordeum vulgare subsp. vulgare TaxID=112509 RepID=A0A8I6YE74_HORVV
MVIPMDPSSTPQPPSGLMTRARACAIETEVTSLLAQPSFYPHETWSLPQVETLCILRYSEQDHGTTMKDHEDAKLERTNEELRTGYSLRRMTFYGLRTRGAQ